MIKRRICKLNLGLIYLLIMDFIFQTVVNLHIHSKVKFKQMHNSAISTQRFYPQQQVAHLQPAELPCRLHPGSFCLNYCLEQACLRLLCEECIGEHLDHHKKNGPPPASISSVKRVREACVDKLTRLIDELSGRLGSLKQPRTPQQILDEANSKFEAIKNLMFKIVEEELARFYEQLKSKVNESFVTLKGLEEVHGNLTRIIDQLNQSRGIVIQGSRQLPDTLEKVLSMDDRLYLDTFSRQAAGYSQKLAYVDFDVSVNQAGFKNAVSESLRITRTEEQAPSMAASRNLSVFGHSQKERSRSRSPINSEKGTRVIIDPNLESEKKQILHFFETGSSQLHLIDLSQKGKARQQTVKLGNYVVPTFHASLLSSQGLIFISGGIIEAGDNQIKTPEMGCYSLQGKREFKRNFSKVKPRSSHSLCEVGDSIYILGGYRPGDSEDPEIQNRVERINMRNGEVEEKSPSRFGGACIAVLFGRSLLKASQEGVQIFNIDTDQWRAVVVPQHYNMVLGCGWTQVSDNSLLVYGGYDDKEKGLDLCYSWELTEGKLMIKRNNFRLPLKEGFLNNPGIIVDREVYALQNIVANEEEEEEEAGSILEGERSLLKFDGTGWLQIKL